METVDDDVMRILLVSLLAIPAVAAAVVALLGRLRSPGVRWVSLGATVICLLLAAILAVAFAVRQAEHRHAEKKEPSKTPAVAFEPEFVPGATDKKPHQTTWSFLSIGPGEVLFYIGLDGLNIWLVVLTALLMVPAVLVSWHAIEERVAEFYAWLLLLETAMLGVFLSFDILLFYIFFELTLVPLFFVIGIWGGPERRYAARKFFIYTLAGSLITLLGVLGIVVTLYQERTESNLTFSIPKLVQLVDAHSRDLTKAVGDASERVKEAPEANLRKQAQADLQAAEDRLAYWNTIQLWVFAALMVGFAIKVPLVPVHTWLPLAHVEAPTAGSVLLAGVLLKVGAYGFLRLCLPLTPDASLALGAPLIGTLAVIGIIYGALCAYAQDDIKKLVAYSSVSHLGFCMLGMFALNMEGLSGSIMQMINHGLSTGALFLLVGMLYERYHTRQMGDYGGMGARLGLLSCFFVFICLTSIGLPGLNGFVGEVLVFMGIFRFDSDTGAAHVSGVVLGIIGTAGIVLGAWYLLTLLRRVFFGPVKEPIPEGHGPVGDLSGRELAALVPIAILCVAIGVYPQPVLDASRRDLNRVASITKSAETRAQNAQRASTARPAALLQRRN
jgi:NADH-quinone oxidoreductase subunit M